MHAFLLRFTFVVFCSVILSAKVAEAAVITGYTDATNDRFTNSAQFIASGYNLSGVGKSSGGQWATLINRNTVVSAYHAQPSGDIFFYADNNPSSTPITRQVVSSQRIGNSDLWVATLNQDVSANIVHYNYATTLLSGTPATSSTSFSIGSAGSFQGENAFLFGQSPTAQPNSQRQAVGRNRISGYSEEVFFLDGRTDAIITHIDASNSQNFVQYETTLVGGDSGAPLFIESNGQLLLLGVNSFIATDPNNNSITIANGSTYIGNYAQNLQNYITVTAVPEPSSLALLSIAAFTFKVVGRRRSMRNSDISL